MILLEDQFYECLRLHRLLSRTHVLNEALCLATLSTERNPRSSSVTRSLSSLICQHGAKEADDTVKQRAQAIVRDGGDGSRRLHQEA
jgi:hypothetical protein